MKIVIQCAGSKAQGAGKLTTPAGEEVSFVAHPPAQPSLGRQYYHPDDIRPGAMITWREHLRQYNLTQRQTNPNALCPAALLYRPPVYKELIEKYGWANVFILSAGWGLLRSDFLTPEYNITFSNQAESWSQRKDRDYFDDFNHLQECELASDERIYFFGGKDYLELYYKLTADLPGHKIIYHAHTLQQRRLDYEYIAYRRFTNWHYACAFDFMRGALAHPTSSHTQSEAPVKEKTYGKNKVLFRVIENPGGFLEIRVYHDNQKERAKIMEKQNEPAYFLKHYLSLSGGESRAKYWLSQVVKDFRGYFEAGKVRFFLLAPVKS